MASTWHIVTRTKTHILIAQGGIVVEAPQEMVHWRGRLIADALIWAVKQGYHCKHIIP